VRVLRNTISESGSFETYEESEGEVFLSEEDSVLSTRRRYSGPKFNPR